MGRAPYSFKARIPKEGGVMLIHVEGKKGMVEYKKSCRLHWLNYLRPTLKQRIFSTAEEDLITRLHRLLGNRWSLIAERLPGRTEAEIKKYWNSHLSDKRRMIDIHPLTHKSPRRHFNNNPTAHDIQSHIEENKIGEVSDTLDISTLNSKDLLPSSACNTTLLQPAHPLQENTYKSDRHHKNEGLKIRTMDLEGDTQFPWNQFLEHLSPDSGKICDAPSSISIDWDNEIQLEHDSLIRWMRCYHDDLYSCFDSLALHYLESGSQLMMQNMLL